MPPPTDRPARRGHVAVIVAARDEADRIAATLRGAAPALPGGARCGWPTTARATPRPRSPARPARGSCAASAALGKGARDDAPPRGARSPGAPTPAGATCSCSATATSASSAAQLRRARRGGRAQGRRDLAVAAFARRVGGGFGLARGFARWAIRRALRARTRRADLRPAGADRGDAASACCRSRDGFGMEIGMTIDAVRGGRARGRVELDLSHRATGRTPAGFAHRGRQLLDFARAYARRASGGARWAAMTTRDRARNLGPRRGRAHR